MSGERSVRARARPAVVGAAMALLGVIASAPVASADTIGAVATAASAWGCAPGLDLIQASPAATYTVTAAGSITGWSTQGGPDTGGLALAVWRPTSVAGTYTIVGLSAGQVPAPNILNSYSLGSFSIPVLPGDVIGLRTTSGIADCLTKTGVATDQFVYSSTQVTTAGATETFPLSNTTYTLNVTATLVPASQPTPTPTPTPTPKPTPTPTATPTPGPVSGGHHDSDDPGESGDDDSDSSSGSFHAKRGDDIYLTAF